MSKKVKIYCYKLAKPVVKSLTKNLSDKVGRVEYNRGFIKENLGITYLITLDKLKKGDEIALSNDFKFSYGGSLNKKINYIPYASDGINASDGSFIVMPGKEFLEVVDPKNSYIETVILDDIINKIFQEEKKEINTDIIEEEKEITNILSEEPVISQVTIEKQEPVMSTDPLDLVAEKPFYYADPEDFSRCTEPLINIEMPEENNDTSNTFSENPEEWFEEEEIDEGELIGKIKDLEVENFKLSKKINNTIEEIKNMSVWDILFWKWKSKLLDILNL